MGSWFGDRLRLNFQAFEWRGIYITTERAVRLVKKVTYFGEFGYLNSSCIRKKYYSWVPGEINSRFCSKTQLLNTDALLVSGRHVGAHPAELQHGVSIQVSLDLGKTFLRISRLRQIVVTWIPARGFAYLPRFWTLSIERFESVLFRSILNGVTLKTSDTTEQLLSFFLLKFPVI